MPATPMLVRSVKGGDFFPDDDDRNYFLARDLDHVEALTGVPLSDDESALLIYIHGQLVGAYRRDVFYPVFEDEVDAERGRQMCHEAYMFIRRSKVAQAA